ncbi:hypothetical protein [Actinomadura gamaensis]|uniref:Uncharacterized protein n=1 Tax=Actinomadura gamaensis TaxID=1763541 RepID=A0ABV9U8R5_9ACTN
MHLRFGFYLHIDKFWPEQQIRNWRQRNWDAVRAMVATHGSITEFYLDDATMEVPSDLTPWRERPQASRLLRDLANGNLDAIAVGTVRHRTFAATPVWDVVALLAWQRKQLWTADVNGPLDPTNPSHILALKGQRGIPKPDPSTDTASPTTRQNRRG